MSGISKGLLDEPEYIHVMINHLPVTGLLVALIFLLLSLLFRSRGAILLSFAMITLLGASAWPVSYFGEEGADRVQSMSYAEGEAWLEAHEERAETWVYLFYVTGGVSLLGLILGAFSVRSLRYTAPIVIVLTLGSLLAGAYIADAGGKVRHSEFRDGFPPEHEAEPKEEPEETEPAEEQEAAPESQEQESTDPATESPESSDTTDKEAEKGETTPEESPDESTSEEE